MMLMWPAIDQRVTTILGSRRSTADLRGTRLMRVRWMGSALPEVTARIGPRVAVLPVAVLPMAVRFGVRASPRS
jgi:hypothetical protein